MDGIGKKFMEMTQYKNMGESAQQQRKTQPPLDLPAEPGATPIPLPKDRLSGLGGQSLLEIIDSRRSLRGYSGAKLTLDELSFLLWCTQGVREQAEQYTLRTVPSAGARHAFETFVLVNGVEGLEPGLYRFLALSHSLVLVVRHDGAAERLTKACLNQRMVKDSAVCFFWVAAAERMTYRYGERGYRYLHLDAGHVCQNLYLAAEAIGCGACGIGAYDDDALNKALGVDGNDCFTVYAAVVGKKPE